jgi:hypothetical protein
VRPPIVALGMMDAQLVLPGSNTKYSHCGKAGFAAKVVCKMLGTGFVSVQ